MGRSMHPANQRIDEAIDRCRTFGVDITPETVRVNLQLGYNDLSADDAIEEALGFRIRRRMRLRGLLIAKEDTRARKLFWEMTPDELAVQQAVRSDSSAADRAQMQAHKAVITFLRSKEAELGYEPYPALFEEEINRIFRMHGVPAPA